MKKRQRQARLIRAAIQLAAFVLAPSLFSTAFAGIKSIFTAMGKGESVTLNSFLQVTVSLLLVTFFFGRYFCGYFCAFGSLGDAVYEAVAFIRKKVFHKKKKLAFPVKIVPWLQKIKYLWLCVLLFCCYMGWTGWAQKASPWDVFSMVTAGRLPGKEYLAGVALLLLIMVGMAFQERFFCQFLCPMGAVFALTPVLPAALLKRKKETCPPRCGLCQRQCPVNLLLDEEGADSGECISCRTCVTACPRGNISTLSTDSIHSDM